MNFYQFHIGDYIKQTVHLTPMEDICYRRLIDMYYETEQPIPAETDRVSRRLRLDTELVDSVLKEFFTLTENGWENARCNKEIDAYHVKADTARSNGMLGGRPKKTHPVSDGNLPESGSKANQEPRTKNQEPITKIKTQCESLYRDSSPPGPDKTRQPTHKKILDPPDSPGLTTIEPPPDGPWELPEPGKIPGPSRGMAQNIAIKLNWQPPEEILSAVCLVMGFDRQRITPEIVGAFTSYHCDAEKYHNLRQWVTKLVNWAKTEKSDTHPRHSQPFFTIRTPVFVISAPPGIAHRYAFVVTRTA